MEEVAAPPAPPKKSTTLSVDRAAFLLLRVKKAFKKKRQQRKEKQTQLGAGAALTAQGRSCRKVPPPPLLRSRTLPAIIVPGIPVVSLQADRSTFQLEPTKSGSNYRWSLLTRNAPTTPGTSGSCSYFNNNNNNSITLKSLNLPKDDSTLVYRRKSSGSTPNTAAGGAASNNPVAQPALQQHAADVSFLQTCEDLECYAADGSVLLRIPAPHVVAARAYRLAAKKRAGEARPADAAQSPYYTHDAILPLLTPVAAGSGTLLNANTNSGASTSGCKGAGTSGGGSANTALTRLAKLLHQSSTTTSKANTAYGDYTFPATLPAPTPTGLGGDGLEDAPRRLSWERRKDSSALQRSASIDSFAEIVWSDSPRPSLDIPRPAPVFSKRPSASSLFSNSSATSQSTQLNINYMGDLMVGTCTSGTGVSGGVPSRRESLLSPSSTRRNKLTRIINDNILPYNLTTYESVTLQFEHKLLHDDDATENSVVLRKNLCNQNNESSLSHRNHAKLPESLMRNNDTHSNKAFRWSEQITQNVSVAKIRTAISCTTPDFKEMEFLIPQAPPPTSKTATRNYAEQRASLPQTKTLQEQQLSSSAGSSNSLAVSRHSRGAVIPTAQQQQNHVVKMSHPKNAKLNDCPDENDVGGNPRQLAIHRQPSNARAKSGGSTPHRNKMSKKQLKLAQAQLDKLTQINLHLHALFSAVEHGHLDKARTILESTDVDVNSLNSDGLSALDVAVLSNNRSMTKMLLQHGSIESSQFSTDTIGTKLNALLKDAESRIHDLSGSEVNCQPTFASRPSISSIIIGNTGSSVTGCTGNEVDKQIGIWERRVKGLRRLLLGWDQARPPDAPASVTVDVTGENSITVQILEPFEGAIGTKFKVQWSTRADFSNVVGEREIMDWTSFHGTMGVQLYVSGLTQGRRYFIRAACGNIKGWGPYKTSVPASIVPSSWRDLNNLEDRYLGRQHVLDNLFTAVRLARPADVSELSLETSNNQRRNPKKKTTIKQLFSVASKFQKHLRRGIYLATVIYCEDKVLVTSEDFLPVIEIDETYPSTLHSDYHWLMKVACTWEDVKSLRTDMERNLTSAVHFRTKLLSAICQMQSALGLTHLGQLYYKPLRDSHGTVVLSCVQSVKSQKTVSILNSRWLPINKLQRKIVALLEDYNINEVLISSVGEQIHYHQSSMQRLEPGLYLGYLKMQCSVEQIQLVVPMKTPNVLPHYKVRENSHITAEEWQILKRSDKSDQSSNARLPLEYNDNCEATTEGQRLFLYDLTTAAHKLFNYMNIKLEAAATHRLYDIEVIEHSKDISFLIICPSVELTCAVPGQSELLLQREDLASLSIQAFELIHLRTYQPGIIQKYARLSCILELDTALANHSHREAFSTTELQIAKERLAKLHELTASLNAVWKSVRWLMDVIAFARDKNAQSSVAMKEILNFAHADEEMSSSSKKQHLLQLPIRDVKFTKSGSGRGSWPGPAGNAQTGSNTNLAAEHSKSEQNLGSSPVTPTSTHSLAPPQTKATTTQSKQMLLKVSSEYPYADGTARKNSGDSVTSQYTTPSIYSVNTSAVSSNTELGAVFAIPSSRSDDTLAMTASDSLKQTLTSATQRKRTSSNITHSATSTPLITVHSSSSAPYLARDAASSSLSLKCIYSADYEALSTKAKSQTIEPQAATISKVRAASSNNLRESGVYLKSTLTALQTDIKTATADEPPEPSPMASTIAKASSTKSLSRQSSEEDNASGASMTSEQATGSALSSGIIQVYTAYNTGLATGTSLKLHVTPKTSAREVINLVVKQLNMAAVLKGNNGPIYSADKLDNFCLVAVIGARERCLRDDFKPLQLQNPWKKGRLYVRQKHELLAAIEHSNRKSQLI